MTTNMTVSTPWPTIVDPMVLAGLNQYGTRMGTSDPTAAAVYYERLLVLQRNLKVGGAMGTVRASPKRRAEGKTMEPSPWRSGHNEISNITL
ncbi:hypothetical protein [Desulfoscipio geothermicus]|uniref:hypothetical protein n=1 Tax=Desulfoscipio geothermicus TaxID=39060 RepID=UPI0010426F36|nr:hypothetical protein [Desulfoscipio geothermicus]